MAKAYSQKVLSASSDLSKRGTLRGETRRWTSAIRLVRAPGSKLDEQRQRKGFGKIQTALIIEHPGTFDSFPYNGEKLRKSLRSMYPDGAVANRRVAPSDGIFLIKPDAEAAKTLPGAHPGFISCAWTTSSLKRGRRSFATSSVRCTENGNRSATGAYHLGAWSGQRAGVKAVSNLQKAVAKFISPRIKMFNRRYAERGMIERLEKAHKYINATLGKAEHYVDLGGSFFTIAVKEGSSERLHLDFRDDHRTLSWLVPMGSYTGGDFIVPQLGYRVPVRPGQAWLAPLVCWPTVVLQ
ncbi:hypothetical protein BKA70DRAFT_1241333 [Coprinopsis sp. MPI-PUGE-AT-0042]|nr:hypothetical protein BKA70DRAFT_1241333 [Coprinopsis sp. MPI-PUGE-AT-0042]